MLRYFIFSLLFCWFSQTMANDILIVASTSPLYEKGQRLTPKATIQLKEGESVSFQTDKGDEVYTQQGPYHDQTQTVGMGTLLEKIIAITALRSAEKMAIETNKIDILQDNAFCFSPNERIVLWRPDMTQTQTLMLKNKQTGQTITQDWLAEEQTLAWPTELELTDDASYLVKIGEQFSKLVFHQLPTDLADTYKANWMLENQCIRQARLLLTQNH